MNILSAIYNELLWRPLFNGLVFFYNVLPFQDLGLAIVALTVAIRLILAPFLWKARIAQLDMAALAPELKKIQERFKGNREAQAKATMKLYAEKKVNPLSGCLIMLIQLPILIALFQVFREGFQNDYLKYLYSFVAHPGVINPVAFGLIDMSRGNIYLGVFAALTQYYQIKLSAPPVPTVSKPGDFQAVFQKQMLYVFPAMILVWSFSFPSALILYWTVLNAAGIVQEIIMRPQIKHGFDHG